ncbi:MAG TPA: type IV toxin-antitoxin system AbiEi family antitoxin domain-containing protein [Solirubrobacteraceae bacterium]|nr:type IV toxin-antitoxin system AbiEi family antitoxin domain-containing protein [Solirubrobacteraceae bacterium]
MAERQEGVVGTRQLRDLGLSRASIGRRVEMGWLIPVLNGVYAVGHRPRTLRGWHHAALLAAGPRAALSHRSAAAHWGMLSPPSRVHVVAPRSADGIAGVAVHRPRLLLDADVTDHEGLRATTPARTLLDLAAGASKRTLERALDRAEAQRLHLPLDALRERCRRRRGAKTLRAVLDWHIAGSTITDSEAEEAFLALVRRAGLPEPVPQHHAIARRRDFAWPRRRLAVEIDSRAFHDTTAAFENDRLRDNELTLAGWTTLRFTYRRVVHRPHEVARDLARALALSGSRLAPAAAG